MTMQSTSLPTIVLSATPKGNHYQATVTFPGGVSMSSAETYPTIGEAMAAAAKKLLGMPDRLAALDHAENQQRELRPFSFPRFRHIH
jgi:hypothetical protein